MMIDKHINLAGKISLDVNSHGSRNVSFWHMFRQFLNLCLFGLSNIIRTDNSPLSNTSINEKCYLLELEEFRSSKLQDQLSFCVIHSTTCGRTFQQRHERSGSNFLQFPSIKMRLASVANEKSSHDSKMCWKS